MYQPAYGWLPTTYTAPAPFAPCDTCRHDRAMHATDGPAWCPVTAADRRHISQADPVRYAELRRRTLALSASQQTPE